MLKTVIFSSAKKPADARSLTDLAAAIFIPRVRIRAH
jgi:hypothetical protein